MKLAVIGGTGLGALAGATVPAAASASTPYGAASATPRFIGERDGAYLNRHGEAADIPPHQINYRANLWLLKELGAEAVVAVFAVGGITRDLADGDIAVPDQIIDYTWGREHTYAAPGKRLHVDVSEPFDGGLRRSLLAAGARAGVALRDGGVYGCTQGPRFETIAEIDRMARDGCTMVGMTAMPEAALARELGLPYAGICLVVNPAAGRGLPTLELADMMAVVEAAEPRLLRLIFEVFDASLER